MAKHTEIECQPQLPTVCNSGRQWMAEFRCPTCGLEGRFLPAKIQRAGSRPTHIVTCDGGNKVHLRPVDKEPDEETTL